MFTLQFMLVLLLLLGLLCIGEAWFKGDRRTHGLSVAGAVFVLIGCNGLCLTGMFSGPVAIGITILMDTFAAIWLVAYGGTRYITRYIPEAEN